LCEIRIAGALQPLRIARRESESAAVGQLDMHTAGSSLVAGDASARLGAQRALGFQR
jgi:hypothetical protein